MKSVPCPSITVHQCGDQKEAVSFCRDFLKDANPRYILGRNEFAESLAQAVQVDGFIDDFTEDKEYCNKPIVRIEDLPEKSMVVVAVVGRPFTAKKRLVELGIRHLDYFAFRRYAGIDIIPVWFLDEFKNDFTVNRDRYDWINGLLEDDQSRNILQSLIDFRVSNDLYFLRKFKDIQYRQYFEDFLSFQLEGEVFVDVGAFDGYTSLEFIKRYPRYKAVHVFEPEPGNMALARKKLAGFPRVNFYPVGLSDKPRRVRFKCHGHASKVSEQGNIEIDLVRLDDHVSEQFTYLKMDVEGDELTALKGSKKAITEYHPALAICVYHRCNDIWRIPEEVFSYRDDYRVYLRHYNEGISETVMFFVP